MADLARVGGVQRAWRTPSASVAGLHWALCALWVSLVAMAACGGDDGNAAPIGGGGKKDVASGEDVQDVGTVDDVAAPIPGPEVSIQAPELLGCVGDTVDLKVKATHELGIALVEAMIGDTVVATATKATGGLFALAVDTAGQPEGPLAIRVRVTAKDGQKGEAVGSWMVDLTPPELTLERPLGQEVILRDLAVRGAASDKGCGIASVKATLTGGDEDLEEAASYGEPAGEATVSLTFHDIAQGTFEGLVTVEVSDAAGNTATEARKVFVVMPLRFLEARSVDMETKSTPTQIVGGDWDGDGLDDALVIGGPETLLMRAVGDGRLEPAQPLISVRADAAALVDVDGDGDLDAILAVPSPAPAVEVWIQLDDGTAERQQVLLMPDALKVTALLATDLTGDDSLDLVSVTATDAKTVVVFRGNEPARWEDVTEGDRPYFSATPKSFGGVAKARAPHAADFDGDGHPDVVVGSQGDSKVSVFLGDGSGGFVAAYDTVVDADPVAVATGYFSGGAWPDLVVASEKSGQLYLLAGKGNGYFETTPLGIAGGKPNSIVTGHFDDDGKLDFAVAHGGANSLQVFLGSTLPGSLMGYVAGPEPSSIVAGQFTDDDLLDLLVLNAKVKQVTLLAGNGDGTFMGAPNLPMPLDCAGDKCQPIVPKVFHVAEADGMPGLDALVPHTVMDTGLMFVYTSDGVAPQGSPGLFSFPLMWGVVDEKSKGYKKGPFVDMDSGDFNGDGRTDLILAYQTNVPTGLPPEIIPVHVDVFLKEPQPGPVYKEPIGSAVGKMVDIAIGDMDGDGVDDLVALKPFVKTAKETTPASVEVYRSLKNGAFELHSVAYVDAAAQADPGAVRLMLADVDVDGHLDAVVLNTLISDVSVLYAKKGILSDGRLVSVVSQNPVAATVAQVNADEDFYSDVLSVGKDVRVAFGKSHAVGEQPFETPFSYSNYPGSKAAGIDGGDFNGDGLFDIVIADTPKNAVYLYAGIGDRQFAQNPTTLYSAPQPQWLYARDMDGDGCVDLVTAGKFGITLLRNLLCD